MGRKILVAVMLALPLSLAACDGRTNSHPEISEMFVNTLICRLQNPDAGARFCAARALGQVRDDVVRKAIPALRCVLLDENHEVRRAAQRALQKIEPALEIRLNDQEGNPL